MPRSVKAWACEFRCEWREDADGIWHTACGTSFYFDTDGPPANGFRFCPYCGKPLTATNYVDPGPTGWEEG